MKRTLVGKVNGTFLRQETAKVPVMELGAVKLLTKASLQRPYTNPILSSEAIMVFRIKRITRIRFFNKTPKDIAKHDGNYKGGFNWIKHAREGNTAISPANFRRYGTFPIA